VASVSFSCILLFSPLTVQEGEGSRRPALQLLPLAPGVLVVVSYPVGHLSGETEDVAFGKSLPLSLAICFALKKPIFCFLIFMK
jgi:hypothetical protein